jgi:hypothetical protein
VTYVDPLRAGLIRIVWVLVLACASGGCSETGPVDTGDAPPDAEASDAGDADVITDASVDPPVDSGAELDDEGDPVDVLLDSTDLDSPDADAAPGDADAAVDVDPDAGGDTTFDSSADADWDVDLGEADAHEPEVPLAGFGTIAGSCGVLDDEEWTATESTFIFVNALDFGDDPYDESDLERLTAGGQAMMAAGGLNDTSLLSEVFAFELLARCELAELLETEGTITYVDPNGKRTDFLAAIDGRQIGVSVTRAHPLDTPFDAARAAALLEGKLADIISSSANVTGDHVWERQILHVLAWDEPRVVALQAGYAMLVDAESPALSNTIVIVTRTDGDDYNLFCAPSAPCPDPD